MNLQELIAANLSSTSHQDYRNLLSLAISNADSSEMGCDLLSYRPDDLDAAVVSSILAVGEALYFRGAYDMLEMLPGHQITEQGLIEAIHRHVDGSGIIGWEQSIDGFNGGKRFIEEARATV